MRRHSRFLNDFLEERQTVRDLQSGSSWRERDNARNSARCTLARKITHGLDGQHQDVDRTPRQSE